jgi:esterase/lipase
MNILNHLAARLVDNLPERLMEELMTEGAMLLSGVDIDIRFGAPIDIGPYLHQKKILKDLQSTRSFDFDDPLPCLKYMRHAALKIMKRYMDAIYHMTTVNHDHIFASLVLHHPKDTMKVEYFRKRAFLAIHQGIEKLSVHLHEGLKENQSHLLIDDRFQRLSDFLSVAEEKGVIDNDGTTIRRHRSTLRHAFDYHRARIDNPVAVMANEVEPLTALRKRISQLCWVPGFMLKTRIAKHFLKKNLQEFNEDYDRYFIEGESKPKDIGRPALWRGRSRRIGVVLSHGYMAAPAEVRQLAKYLAAKGYWVYTPRLRGHGTAPEDLACRSYKEWIYSMEDGYILMRNTCRHVVLGGFSTGAALALELASRLGDVIGVFAVSTPLRLQYLTSRFAPLVDTWNKLMGKVRLDDVRKEFVENRPENPNINYFRNPISGVRELERLMNYVEPKLSGIQVPALIVQGKDDPVVHPAGSERIFNLLGSADKQYIVYNYDRHGILLGEGSHRVHRAIGDFIDQLVLPPKQQPPEKVSKET